ncbi:MAG: Gfo/Idh/MocA family oxidoreductase, partial [Bacteroidales bacterium]|nr:Gfo/Idh/MocA family oxidoreductase [Bacteroidales bacterium]
MTIDRRNFIKTTAIAAAGVALAPGNVFGIGSSNSKVRLGFIGVGLRGEWHLHNALARDDVEVTAICDINPKRLVIAQDMIQKARHHKAVEYGKNDYDYRNLLEQKNIDAVIISTPWLWHTP